MRRIPYLDSHTGGEPTRLILELPFDLGTGPVSEKLSRLKKSHDSFRRMVINEPRGSDILVGAYLLPSEDPECDFGVVFFNNVGYLGMCGHGTIGVVASLAYLGRVEEKNLRIETPVGVVEAILHPKNPEAAYPNKVSVRNVPAYRYLKQVRLEVDGKTIHGDVAWGGNWFFLSRDHGLEISLPNIEQLTEFAGRIRQAYEAQGLTGPDGAEIDHVELFADTPEADSRSFVLCPGRAYDRSPCGTGTSAKLACLVEDGELAEGQVWRQQSVVGSIFEGRIERSGGRMIPVITGEVWVMAEGYLLVDERDPFQEGIWQVESL